MASAIMLYIICMSVWIAGGIGKKASGTSWHSII